MGILLVVLWTTFQLGVSQIQFPAKIGDPCPNDDRCNKWVNNTVCRDSVCACAIDYVPNSANLLCLRVASNINDSCEEAIQCTERFGLNAECNSQKMCSCKPENHFVSASHKCIPDIGLDRNCTHSAECYLPDDGSDQNVECAQGLCKCTARYNPSPESRSCRSSAGTKIISITCLVGVWILHLLMQKLNFWEMHIK